MAATAKKMLLLRSAEGKVLMAPAWDTRLFAQFLPPLETPATTRALEKVIEHWARHECGRGDADLSDWDKEFVCHLGEEKGLPEEVHAAAVLLQRQNLVDLLVMFASSKTSALPCPDDGPVSAMSP
jgi:hypothetical protein